MPYYYHYTLSFRFNRKVAHSAINNNEPRLHLIIYDLSVQHSENFPSPIHLMSNYRQHLTHWAKCNNKKSCYCRFTSCGCHKEKKYDCFLSRPPRSPISMTIILRGRCIHKKVLGSTLYPGLILKDWHRGLYESPSTSINMEMRGADHATLSDCSLRETCSNDWRRNSAEHTVYIRL